ncbi:MAG: hypothetical protein HC881_23925 [Leptolyngbyaceae cyanobacterium SL_7_1]|nr:hypothetical protein [Leptolyngbyaceae cyanobacterium SL_7_1]
MDHNQQELRRVAEQAFLESLDQLSASIQPSEVPVVVPSSSNAAPTEPTAPFCNISLDAWEEAAADIEAFMKAREQE